MVQRRPCADVASAGLLESVEGLGPVFAMAADRPASFAIHRHLSPSGLPDWLGAVARSEWREVLIEDRHAGPAETAAARIDIGEWFARLPKHKRRVAQTLATGETTKRTARKFRVSPGRISQTRRELQNTWQEFQGEAVFA